MDNYEMILSKLEQVKELLLKKLDSKNEEKDELVKKSKTAELKIKRINDTIEGLQRICNLITSHFRTEKFKKISNTVLTCSLVGLTLTIVINPSSTPLVLVLGSGLLTSAIFSTYLNTVSKIEKKDFKKNFPNEELSKEHGNEIHKEIDSLSAEKSFYQSEADSIGYEISLNETSILELNNNMEEINEEASTLQLNYSSAKQKSHEDKTYTIEYHYENDSDVNRIEDEIKRIMSL